METTVAAIGSYAKVATAFSGWRLRNERRNQKL